MERWKWKSIGAVVCGGILAGIPFSWADVGQGTMHVYVLKATAEEGGERRASLAAFRIHFDGTQDVELNVQWSGSATMGSASGGGSDADYEYISTRLLIRPGDNTVIIKTYDDLNAEQDETVMLTLLPGEGYTLDSLNWYKRILIESNE